MSDYEVKAKITIDGSKAKKGVDGLNDSFSQMQNTILAGVAAFAGFSIASSILSNISSGFKSVITEGVKFSSELEKSKISLTSIFQALSVGGKDWAGNAQAASKVYGELTEDALKSTATTKELFDIYKDIAGPIQSATGDLSKVREITNDTVAAASVLGIDYAQASRDITMMVRGSAGVDVKTFSIMKSMGLISENAEAFNKLSQSARIEKMGKALASFRGAAKEFGDSFAGVTSTFDDIKQQFLGAVFEPITKSFSSALGKVNDAILKNSKKYKDVLGGAGGVFAKAIGPVGDVLVKLITRLGNFFDKNGAKIIAKMELIGDKVEAFIKATLKPLEDINIGKVSQTTAQVGGVAAIGGGGILAALKLPEFLKALAPLSPVFTQLASYALPMVGAAVLALASMFLFISDYWAEFMQIFYDSSDQLFVAFWELAEAIWKAALPMLKALGAVFVAQVVPAIQTGIVIVTALLKALKLVFDFIGTFTNSLYTELKPALDSMVAQFQVVAKMIDTLFRRGINATIADAKAGKFDKEYIEKENRGKQLEKRWAEGQKRIAEMFSDDYIASINEQAAKEKTENKSLKSNNIKVDKIIINQEFPGKANPDRIIQAFKQDLVKEVNLSLSTKLVNPFSR